MLSANFPLTRLLIRLTAIAAVISLGLMLEPLAAQLEPAQNIALQKPAVASSNESAALTATKANDGNDLNTRWSSQFADNQWLYIDLQASYEVEQIVLKWESAYGESYDIDVSFDGLNWQTVFEERSSNGGIDTINFGTPVAARFVRMTGLERATTLGFSLWEFEIYGLDPTPRYVDDSGADGSNNCLDFDSPCATVTHAISQANIGNTLHIAAGTYTEAIVIDKSLTLQGASADSTILQAHASPGAASQRVITIPDGLGLAVAIADVTIRHGQVSGSEGGGILNSGSDLALSNVILTQNRASVGGGIFSWYSTGSYSNVIFHENMAVDNGGGIAIYRSSLTLTDITFSSNTADHGGGMYNNASSPTLTNVTFSSNMAVYQGGGMRNNFYSAPILSNVTFSDNEAEYGAGMSNADSSPTLTNVTFSSNMADDSGGGMYNNESAPILNNVTFNENEANNGAGMSNDDVSSPTLTDITFSSNTAVNDGGGINNLDNSSPTLTGVTFNDNEAYFGGGMSNYVASSPTLTNVNFSSNTADYGGGIYNFESSPTLTNVTFSNNTAVNSGGGMHNGNNSSPLLINTIIWGNMAGSNSNGNEIYNSSNGAIELSYSLYKNDANDIVSGGGFTADAQSLTTDPLFVDAPNGDLTLQEGSVAIDAGSNAQCSALDRQGGHRPVDGDGDGLAVCDMGAFEYGSSSHYLYLPLVIK